MPSKQGRIILVILLVGLGIVSWRLYSVDQEKRQLATSYTQAQQTLSELTQERSQLKQELSEVQTSNRAATAEVNGLQQELSTLQERLEQTMTDLTLLQQQHEQLRQENTSLEGQLSSLAAEKQALEAKLSSIKELQLAIRAVKEQMSAERWAAWRRRIAEQRAEDERLLAKGNRGLVIKQGVSTLVGSASKLQVRVLEPETP